MGSRWVLFSRSTHHIPGTAQALGTHGSKVDKIPCFRGAVPWVVCPGLWWVTSLLEGRGQTVVFGGVHVGGNVPPGHPERPASLRPALLSVPPISYQLCDHRALACPL